MSDYNSTATRCAATASITKEKLWDGIQIMLRAHVTAANVLAGATTREVFGTALPTGMTIFQMRRGTARTILSQRLAPHSGPTPIATIQKIGSGNINSTHHSCQIAGNVKIGNHTW